jgi:hypothetical protein
MASGILSLCGGAWGEAHDSSDLPAFLRGLPERSLADVAKTLVRVPRGGPISASGSVSPDGRYLAVKIRLPGRGGLLRVVAIEEGRTVAELLPETTHGLTLYPRSTVWSLDSRHLYVRYTYIDSAYGEWVEFSTETWKPTDQGVRELDQLLAYDMRTRPFAKRLCMPGPPFWSSCGRRYDSYNEAWHAGDTKPFQRPTFLGRAAQGFYRRADKQLYSVLVEPIGIRQQEYPTNQWRGHVFKDGKMLATLRLARPFISEATILFAYREGRLMAYGGFTIHDQHTGSWRADLGRRELSRQWSLDGNRVVIETWDAAGVMYYLFDRRSQQEGRNGPKEHRRPHAQGAPLPVAGAPRESGDDTCHKGQASPEGRATAGHNVSRARQSSACLLQGERSRPRAYGAPGGIGATSCSVR